LSDSTILSNGSDAATFNVFGVYSVCQDRVYDVVKRFILDLKKY